MNLKYYLLVLLVAVFTLNKAEENSTRTTMAEWTVVVYIQANNNLGPYAEYNVQDMIKGIAADTSAVNILVQWEKPNATTTLRYKVTKKGLVNLGSLNYAMGEYPTQGIINCTQWVKADYPAKHYLFILWNHGSGYEDVKSRTMLRGILYDDLYGTFLANSDLTTVLTQMNTILGQPLDILGMDACLMNMVEVVYQVRGMVNYVVGSEQTEPGDGWAYAGFINALTANPTKFDAKKLSQTIVKAIGSYYQKESDFTASALDMSYLDSLKTNIDTVVTKVNACKQYNATQIKNAVIAARRNSLVFYVDDYIDLYTFYQKLLQQVTTIRNASKKLPLYVKALDALSTAINQGMQIIKTAIVATANGKQDASAGGISIYYLDLKSKANAINTDYAATLYAQQSPLWVTFIKENR
jgi:hypothetical protein